ncbi:MAG: AtpZ/AtpI family protein [Chloroflexi bacterium]|nr:AtpZ/AtpI family protein [Chloroflexota bacterium]
MRNRGQDKRPPALRREDVYRLLGFGWYFAIMVVGGILVGIWLDRVFNTKPTFLIVGLLLGSALGFVGMFRLLRPYRRRNNGEKKQE